MVHTSTSIQPALPSPGAGVCVTLADVMARIKINSDIPLRQRREMLSALHTVARLLNTAPSAIPAQPGVLRQCLAAVSPAAAGISHGRWNNVRSLTLAALKLAGVRTLRGCTREVLTPDWEALRACLPDAKARYGLSRFMSVCSERQIAPGAVDAAVFAQLQQALETDSLTKAPHTVYRTACVLWNRAAQTIVTWPTLTVPVPSGSRRYARDWTDFPASFCADANAFLDQPGNQDLLADDYVPSTKPSTMHMRRKQILQIATALAAAGVPVQDITALAVMVEVANAKLALRFFLDRAGKQATKYLHQQALLLKTIARHWVKAQPAQVEALGAICRQLAPKHTGMTDKNRARLRQFDSRANVDALLNLPSRVLREVGQDDPGGRREALRVMFALAVELLTVAPVRIDNLAGLEIERHFLHIRSGVTSVVHLVIPAAETKNGAPYEVALPEVTAAVLASYCTTYHPRLSPGPSRWLFPNAQGERRDTTAFATEISRFVLRETGIQMNVHLFHHLAVKLHLEAHPEDVETARRILGHKSVTTTLRSYVEVKSAAAFRRYDHVIQTLREQAVVVPRRTKSAGARS